MKQNIIIRNFFRLMRSGAMNEYVEMEPMSPYKWRKLITIVTTQKVAAVALRAVKNFQFEPSFNMPQAERDRLQAEAAKESSLQMPQTMENPFLRKKLQRIKLLEVKAEDYSPETLNLFLIIIANCHAILTTGTSMLMIIKLGNYVRINGKKIDYSKVNKWLSEMQMQRVASLLGTILIENFAFSREELPFVKKIHSEAAQTMCEALVSDQQSRHNSGITYFEYAPLENASILINRLKGCLDSIEE